MQTEQTEPSIAPALNSNHVFPETTRSDIGKRGEIFLMVSAVVILFCCAVQWSRHKLQWTDEVFTWNELRDPSLSHMLHAIMRGADGGMPVFYITGWLWCHTFGDADLTLRLYSCCCICAALIVIWTTLRRYYGVWPTAFGVLLTCFTSLFLLFQWADARFYGLYMFVTAAVVSVSDRLAQTENPSRRLLLAGFLLNGCLVLSHVLGIIYAGLALAALAVWDLQAGRSLRWKVYLSQAAGWTMLLLWLPAIRASAAAARPHGWIPPANLRGLAQSYFLGMFGPWLVAFAKVSGNHPIWGVLLLSGIAMLVPILNKRRSVQRSRNPREPLTFIAVAFLIAPLIVFVLSVLVTPILIPRYVLPTLIGYLILLARFAARWLTPFAANKWVYWAFLLITLTTPLAANPIVQPLLTRTNDLDIGAVQAVPPDRGPMVVGNIINFMPLMRYSTPEQQQRYVYLLDWDAALKEYAAAVPDYHLLLAYRNNGYFPGRIQFADEFLCAHRNFLVLDSPTGGLFDVAIRTNPRYRWSVVQVLDPRRSIFEVIQTSVPPTCPAASH